MAEPPQANRRAVLSFRLGICSLFLGPLTGMPAILLGWLGLRDVRRSAGRLQGTGLARFGMLAGFAGTALVSWCVYAMATEVIWPSVGKRVDRIFREIDAENFEERQDGIWPTFRAIAPQILYRAAEKKWPGPTQGPVAVSGWIMRLPSGDSVHRQRLWNSAQPIIALGKPAVPHLFKWVMHNDLHVRYVAQYALKHITGIEIQRLGHFVMEDPEGQRQKTIRMWQEWYDEQP